METARVLKVLVVDDHPLIRSGVAAMLSRQETRCIVIEAQDCQSAIEILSNGGAPPDLILLDLNLPDRSGLAALSTIRDAAPFTPVVVLSAEDDRKTIIEALNLGAMGFIPKTMSPELIWSALGLVLNGGIYVPHKLIGDADSTEKFSQELPAAVDGMSALKSLGLTDRQIDTLRMLVQGKPNKTIAHNLGIAEATVKVYVSAVLRALNVTSRTQAVIWLSKNGIQFESLVGAYGSKGNNPA